MEQRPEKSFLIKIHSGYVQLYLSVFFGMVGILLQSGHTMAADGWPEYNRMQQSQMQRTIRGKVMDDKGIPIPGANVWVKGTTLGVATDVEGN